jgi:hypothetical protein
MNSSTKSNLEDIPYQSVFPFPFVRTQNRHLVYARWTRWETMRFRLEWYLDGQLGKESHDIHNQSCTKFALHSLTGRLDLFFGNVPLLSMAWKLSFMFHGAVARSTYLRSIYRTKPMSLSTYITLRKARMHPEYEKANSSLVDALGRRERDAIWGDMRIISSLEVPGSKGVKYIKKYHETGPILRTFKTSRSLFASVQSLCNKLTRSCGISPNYNSSTFHDLPVEILLEIAEFASPVTILALKRVCSKFRTCLARLGPAIESESLWMTERYQFIFLLRRDRFSMLRAEYERSCAKRDLKWPFLFRGCSQCLELHSIDEFSASQLRSTISPNNRICSGLEGAIELCEHFSWSAECIGRGLQVLEGLGLRCSFEHSRDIDGNTYDHFSTALNPVLRYSNFGKIIEIERAFPLFSLHVNELATHEMLSTALQTLDGYVCPHLRTSSPNFFNGQAMTAECTSNPIWPKKGDCSLIFLSCHRLLNGGCMVWSGCRSPNCGTRYGLRRVQLPIDPLTTDLVILEVSRRLVNGPTDPSWKAQVLRPSADDEAAIEMDRRRKNKSADCEAKLWACQGMFCGGRYKSRFLTQR